MNASDERIHGTTWSTSIYVITWLMICLSAWFTGLAVWMMVREIMSPTSSFDPGLPILAGVLDLVMVIAGLYAPMKYGVSGRELIIHRPLGKLRVPKSSICGVQPLGSRKCIGCGLRIFGSGGLFGGIGLFWSPAFGRYWAYVTRSDRLVLVWRVRGWPLLLSPDDPQRFVEDLGVEIRNSATPDAKASRKAVFRAWGFVAAAVLAVAGSAAGVAIYLSGVGRPLTFEIVQRELRIGGNVYGRTFQKAEMNLDRARVVNLDAEKAYQPVQRTNGTAYGSYRAGWFGLRSGEKALLFVNRWPEVLIIPTVNGYTLMLSPEHPVDFLNKLKAM